MNETTRTALVKIQSALVAPKGRYNDFAKFAYRSCEDILHAAKPLLDELDCTLTLQDNIVLVGEGDNSRFYVQATATLSDPLGNSWSTVGYAREPILKKGMDESQITGTASSYARKYALSGLLLLDDNEDPDSKIVVSELEADEFYSLVEGGEGMRLLVMSWEDPDRYFSLSEKAVPKTGKVKYREALKSLTFSALETGRNIATELMELLDREDDDEVRAILETLTPDQKKVVWRVLNRHPNVQDKIKQIAKAE